MLATAFRANPLNRAVIQASPEACERANRFSMQALLPVAIRHGRVRVAVRAEAMAGVAVSVGPGRFPLPAPPWIPRWRAAFGQGLRVSARWGEVFDALSAAHAIEPHWYLASLGVEPGSQRTGIGSALMEDWIRSVDSEGMPAYLETDSAANVRFYEGFGFRVRREVEVLGIPIWLLWRAAEGSPGRAARGPGVQ